MNMNNKENKIGFKFKLASSKDDFIKIHKLNYETFVEEIPQHSPNENGMLIDAFHEKNLYFICLYGDVLAGMVAINSQPPFSLESKIGGLDKYLTSTEQVCEIRLLSIAKEYRKGSIIRGLLTVLGNYCLKKNYKIAIISGNVKEQRMYHKLGFVNFGPIVCAEAARYKPMYLNLDELSKRFEGLG